MNDKVVNWVILVIGVLLVLPLIGVNQLAGSVTSWVIALGVLLIGVLRLMKK